MINIKKTHLLSIVFVTLCFNQSVCADKRLDNYEQQLGQMQQQLNSLRTVEWDIKQFEKQLDSQEQRLSEMGLSVVENRSESIELNNELIRIRKQIGIQRSQIEKDIAANEHKSDELRSNLSSVRKKMESGTIELANSIQSLDNKLTNELSEWKINYW